MNPWLFEGIHFIMSGMYRIIGRKLLVLIRLAIVMSLAGYSLSNASAAMHGGGNPPALSSVSMESLHAEAGVSHDHHDHASADDEDGSSAAKQECCKDFCASFALIVAAGELRGPVVSSASGFLNDRGLSGQMPALHRPPNI